MNRTERILEQGQALVRAIEALEVIEPTGPLERAQVWLLLQAYRHRLRAIVAAAPAWLAEEILSASQEIESDRPAVWLSEN
jgi:hypothetical protein